MMEQMVQFYVANFPNRMKGPADYKTVGEQMFRRYPCIKRYMLAMNFLCILYAKAVKGIQCIKR